ncbi:MAG: rRNA maturation RNase YbeY [Candidatus Aminicenantes bacterium]|nr:rRNA maturation RNase YbeY [Candidatus Aminicenantes bacterium]
MVQIINRQRKHKIREKHFRHLVSKLLSFYSLPKAEVSLVFTGNSSIKRLNRQFRKKDMPTDVLSFPMAEKGIDGQYYLGDIIISVPQAYFQCGRKESELEKELDRLIIHGFLHLLGYNHGSEMEKEAMKIKAYLRLK